MDFRQTFQSANNRNEEPAHVATSAETNGKKPGKRGKDSGVNLQSLFSLLLLFGIAALLLLLALSFLTKGNANGEEKFVDTKKYQAVFLNNGQVYFGKIGGISSNYVDLRSVYYLTQTTATGANGATNATGDYTLVKLGCQQIHNPLDQMVVSRDQVSFWENLSDDGKVVKSIKEFQKQNPNGPDCTQVSNQTQATSSPATTQQSTTPAPTTPSTNRPQ